MKPNLAELARDKEQLLTDLSRVRRNSLQASDRGDFRGFAKLTLEAARINRAISENELNELQAS